MAKTLIIGGGAIGLSTAFHLARLGAGPVTVLERAQLTSGTSWHAAGIVGPLRGSVAMTQVAAYALDLFPEIECLSGQATGYQRTGGYWLAREAARMDELYRTAAIGRAASMTPQVIGPEALPEYLNTDGLIGALQVPEDGSVNPVDLCMAYAKAARDLGVTIRENTAVAEVLADSAVQGARLDTGEEIPADRIAICCGAWSRSLTAPLGVALPLGVVEHMYAVSEPIDLPRPFPVLRDLDRGIYVKGDAGKLVFGAFETEAKPMDPSLPAHGVPFLELPADWDHFTPYAEAATGLIPALSKAGIVHFMNGPESFSFDGLPLVGETPEIDGLYVAAGMNSVGVMSSAGIGRLLADAMAHDAPETALWDLDIARADPAIEAHMAERVGETVANTFAIHWPFKQPETARNVRQSPLNAQFAEDGAVFGVTAGWERGLWYAREHAERDLPYSIGRQAWQDIAIREARVLQTSAVLLDLTPFSKFTVTGPQSLNALQYLCTADLDRPVGRAVYCQMLNARGGIEADVTVTRLAEAEFAVISGAATRRKDFAWLRRRIGDGVSLKDVTEDACVLGVMGPDSLRIMLEISDEPFDPKPFSWAQEVVIGGTKLRATRLSFVGELGWELIVPNAHASMLYATLRQAGAAPMGHYALDGCRLEKGYRHWGHDIGPGISPAEAGLGFATDWAKGDFLGREAALDRRNAPKQHLQLYHVAGDRLILQDEPIWQAGRVVGHVTSGGFGPRTGMTLAFGLLHLNRADPTQPVDIEVADQKYPATPLPRAPYDPDNERMRT